MKELNRFVWYLAKRAAVILLVLTLGVFVFYYAMNASNINIVLKDGMALRAKVIMMDEDSDDLTRYFGEEWLLRDENLQQALRGESPYKLYIVRGIDHRITLNWFFCLPWDTTATVTFTERIPRVDGRLNGNYLEWAQSLFGDSYQEVPAWPEATYRASLVKVDGQWKIRSLSMVGGE